MTALLHAQLCSSCCLASAPSSLLLHFVIASTELEDSCQRFGASSIWCVPAIGTAVSPRSQCGCQESLCSALLRWLPAVYDVSRNAMHANAASARFVAFRPSTLELAVRPIPFCWRQDTMLQGTASAVRISVGTSRLCRHDTLGRLT